DVFSPVLIIRPTLLNSPLFPYTTLFRSVGPQARYPGLRSGRRRPRRVGSNGGFCKSIASSPTRLRAKRRPTRTTLKPAGFTRSRSEEHTSELQSRGHLVCRLLLEKKKKP